MIKSLIVLLLVNYIHSQATFGKLSSSALQTTTALNTATTVSYSFGTLSTAPNTATSTTTTTTSASVTTCTPEVSALCRNGATCQIINQNFACLCATGFVGVFCENAITTTTATSTTTLTTTAGKITQCSPEVSVLCKNGATCQIDNQTFGCLCAPGFTGVFCDTVTVATTTTSTTTTSNPNSCTAQLSALCKNGATCQFTNGIFSCLCPAGFTGTFCENLVTVTTTTPITTTTTMTTTTANPTTMCSPELSALCKNGATCQISNNMFLCLCTPGFTGMLCDVNISGTTVTATTMTTTTTSVPTTTTTGVVECPTNVCLNGGNCSISSGGLLQCQCSAGFTGTRCETQASFCDSSPCKNGGLCLQTEPLKGLCFCVGNYSGLYCESIGCSPNPCQNNQQCITGADGKGRCLCSSSFTGSYCESPVAV